MTIFTSKDQYLLFKQAWAKAAQSGDLTAGHFLLYNLLLDRKLTTGFTPTFTARKLPGRTGVNSGVCLAAKQLTLAKGWEFKQKQFLGVLGNTITPEMLEQIKVPHFELLEFNYGVGKMIYTHLLENPMILTYDNLDPLVLELIELRQPAVV